MDKRFNILYKGEFATVVKPLEATSYEILHERDVVWIVPILDGKVGIRKEWVPPYLLKDETGEELYYTIISGTVEEKEKDLNALMRELLEEAGISIIKGKIITTFKKIPVCKSTDMRATLFVLDIEKYKVQKPKGDGSVAEKKSETVWISIHELYRIIQQKNIDMLVFCAYNVVKLYLTSKSNISID